MELISCYAATAVLRNRDVQMSTRTFLSLVNTAQANAPAPKRQVGPAAFWDRRDVADWATELGNHSALADAANVDAEYDHFGELVADHAENVVLLSDWVEQDPRRADYSDPNNPEQLFPRGWDYGPGWRGLDRVLQRVTPHPGARGFLGGPGPLEWVLRLNSDTGDVFFWTQGPDFARQVFPLGCVPDSLPYEGRKNWLAPLECAARQRNSIGLILAEYALHERLDWAALAGR